MTFKELFQPILKNYCGCCSNTNWIQFTIWSQIVLYSVAVVVCSLAMILSTSFANQLFLVIAFVMYMIVGILQPILPAFLMSWLVLSLLPTDWKRMIVKDNGEFQVFLMMELMLILFFIVMAFVLLKGFKEKNMKCLNAWMVFGMTCIILIIFEGLFILIAYLPTSSQLTIWLYLIVVGRSSLAIVNYMAPLVAIKFFKQEIQMHMENEEEVTGDVFKC